MVVLPHVIRNCVICYLGICGVIQSCGCEATCSLFAAHQNYKHCTRCKMELINSKISSPIDMCSSYHRQLSTEVLKEAIKHLGELTKQWIQFSALKLSPQTDFRLRAWDLVVLYFLALGTGGWKSFSGYSLECYANIKNIGECTTDIYISFNIPFIYHFPVAVYCIHNHIEAAVATDMQIRFSYSVLVLFNKLTLPAFHYKWFNYDHFSY